MFVSIPNRTNTAKMQGVPKYCIHFVFGNCLAFQTTYSKNQWHFQTALSMLILKVSKIVFLAAKLFEILHNQWKEVITKIHKTRMVSSVSNSYSSYETKELKVKYEGRRTKGEGWKVIDGGEGWRLCCFILKKNIF